MICTVSGRPYRVFGYKGKQVRDNIHSFDLVEAFAEFIRAPRVGEVYKIGGSRHSNCSMLEAIEMCDEIRESRYVNQFTSHGVTSVTIQRPQYSSPSSSLGGTTRSSTAYA
jgi:dTDP-D-glucose 4,6-dehydratase